MRFIKCKFYRKVQVVQTSNGLQVVQKQTENFVIMKGKRIRKLFQFKSTTSLQKRPNFFGGLITGAIQTAWDSIKAPRVSRRPTIVVNLQIRKK